MKNVPRILFFLICAYKIRFVFVSTIFRLEFRNCSYSVCYLLHLQYLTIFLSNIAGVTRGAGQLALSSLIPVRCYGAGAAQLEFSVFVHGDYCFSLSLLFSLFFLAMQLLQNAVFITSCFCCHSYVLDINKIDHLSNNNCKWQKRLSVQYSNLQSDESMLTLICPTN